MLDADTRTHPHDGADADDGFVDGDGCVAIKVGGSVDIWFQCEIGKVKAKWQHPDDGQRFAIDSDGFAYDCGVGVEVSAPEMIADHSDGRSRGPVFVFGKEAPKLRNASEHGEEVCSHVGAADTQRFS